MHLSSWQPSWAYRFMAIDFAPYFAHISDDTLSRAFTARRAAMPFRGRKRVEAEKVSSRWQEMFANPVADNLEAAGSPVPTYLSVPIIVCSAASFAMLIHQVRRANMWSS